MAELVTAVGVPLISPVEVSKDNPAGRDGETDQEVTGPPLADGVTAVIAVPFVKVKEFGLYEIEDGATSLTSIVTVAVSLPPVLDAVIVYVADDVTAVGVPLISPVEVSKDKPAGRDGETDHDVTGPPLEDGVTAVIAVPLVRVNELGLYEIEEGATSFTSIVTVAVSLPPVLLAVIV